MRSKEAADRGDTDANIQVLIRKSLDELVQKPEYESIAKGWQEQDRVEVCGYWHKLDGSSPCSHFQ